jgi:hypothetical protein
MENKTEDEIRRRWEVEAKERNKEEEAQRRPKKRVRAIEYNGGEGVGDIFGSAKVVPKKKTERAVGARAKSRLSEIGDEDGDGVVELD